MAGEVQRVVESCRERLGDPHTWAVPAGYPQSLALCVLDAVWSIGVRYGGVENVIAAYRHLRREAGGDPERDDVDVLATTIEAIGGAEEFAVAVGNMQRTSTRHGILKAEAVSRACAALSEAGVRSTQELKGADDATLDQIAVAWRKVPGQRSGISWRYLLLLSGRQEVKPDRMIVRFVARAIGREPSPLEAARLVAASAPLLGADVRVLDHAVWRYQRGQR